MKVEVKRTEIFHLSINTDHPDFAGDFEVDFEGDMENLFELVTENLGEYKYPWLHIVRLGFPIITDKIKEA